MMKKIFYTFFIVLIAVFWTGCEKDSNNGNSMSKYFVVAFTEESASYSQIENNYQINIKYSEIATADGSMTIKLNEKNATYGVDYSTLPVASDLEIVLPIKKGTLGTELVFKNLIYPFDRDDKTIQFEIAKIEYPQPTEIQGYSMLMVTFEASFGGVIEPNIGGSTEPNQVYIELSTKNSTSVQRDTWDLAFYSGNEDIVKLNGSVYMAAARLNYTNIDLVSNSDLAPLEKEVAIGTFDPINVKYIDHPSGDLNKTAIAKIEEDDALNNVYLVNLGYYVGNSEAGGGGVNVSGDLRGWKKIRILKRGSQYLLQYANVNDVTHKEVLISKNQTYNFQFYSLSSEKLIKVEPAKGKWDLNFTVFTNINEAGSYGYSDFIVGNIYGDVTAYPVKILKEQKNTFEKFALADVKENLFESDLRTIGSSWREVASGKKLFSDVYYIIKDGKGNYYKFRMLAFMNENGERGYPRFEYKLLR